MMNAKLLSIAVAVAGVSGCTKQDPPLPITSAPMTAPSASSVHASVPAMNSTGLTRVTDRSLVCMVNNQFMGRPQIPVQVEGKTYYGCCEMCKDRLAKDSTARTGVDPVSNRPIDKSLAVIAKAESGAALYFENEANFAAYSTRLRGK
jgi:YHS domain-containing protein